MQVRCWLTRALALSSVVLWLVLQAGTPALAAAQDWEPFRVGDATDRTLLSQIPHTALAVRRRLSFSAERRDSRGVRAGLRDLAAMGYLPTQATIRLLSPYLSPTERTRMIRRFAAVGRPLVRSDAYETVPPRYRLIEGVARDQVTGRLFVASVVDRALLMYERGIWNAVPGLSAGSLFGMAIDTRRRLLWLASGSVEQTPHPETAFHGLISVNLDTLRVVSRIATPGSPGDVTVAPDGTVYASDATGGAVFRVRRGAASILVPPGRFRSPQGLVVSNDAQHIYVADYAYGIGIVDLASGRVRRLEARGAVMLDGVDGMVGDCGSLIVIQNGINPHRIARLRLNPAGTEVRRVEVLERANPTWGEPTLGTISGRTLLYIADGQWERFAAQGRATHADRPTPIRAVALGRRQARAVR